MRASWSTFVRAAGNRRLSNRWSPATRKRERRIVSASESGSLRRLRCVTRYPFYVKNATENCEFLPCAAYCGMPSIESYLRRHRNSQILQLFGPLVTWQSSVLFRPTGKSLLILGCRLYFSSWRVADARVRDNPVPERRTPRGDNSRARRMAIVREMRDLAARQRRILPMCIFPNRRERWEREREREPEQRETQFISMKSRIFCEE